MKMEIVQVQHTKREGMRVYMYMGTCLSNNGGNSMLCISIICVRIELCGSLQCDKGVFILTSCEMPLVGIIDCLFSGFIPPLNIAEHGTIIALCVKWL